MLPYEGKRKEVYCLCCEGPGAPRGGLQAEQPVGNSLEISPQVTPYKQDGPSLCAGMIHSTLLISHRGPHTGVKELRPGFRAGE